MKKHELIELVKIHLPNSNSINNLIVEKLKLKSGGGLITSIKKIIEDFNLDISHFDKNKLRYTAEKVINKCAVCDTTFMVNKNVKRKKLYCSVSCSNKDRLLSDETKSKISEKNKINTSLRLLHNKYGFDLVNYICELLVKSKPYDEILELVPEITKDELIKIKRVSGLIKHENTLDINYVKEKYFELKNIKKVAKFFLVSIKDINTIITKDIMLKNNRVKISKSDSVVSWRQRKKQELVEYKGGCCEICGYNKSIQALQFHHIDPNEKDFNISARSYSIERLKKEADKCMLVCANCHIEVHEELRKLK
jgi:hypothetical protein